MLQNCKILFLNIKIFDRKIMSLVKKKITMVSQNSCTIRIASEKRIKDWATFEFRRTKNTSYFLEKQNSTFRKKTNSYYDINDTKELNYNTNKYISKKIPKQIIFYKSKFISNLNAYKLASHCDTKVLTSSNFIQKFSLGDKRPSNLDYKAFKKSQFVLSNSLNSVLYTTINDNIEFFSNQYENLERRPVHSIIVPLNKSFCNKFGSASEKFIEKTTYEHFLKSFVMRNSILKNIQNERNDIASINSKIRKQAILSNKSHTELGDALEYNTNSFSEKFLGANLIINQKLNKKIVYSWNKNILYSFKFNTKKVNCRPENNKWAEITNIFGFCLRGRSVKQIHNKEFDSILKDCIYKSPIFDNSINQVLNSQNIFDKFYGKRKIGFLFLKTLISQVPKNLISQVQTPLTAKKFFGGKSFFNAQHFSIFSKSFGNIDNGISFYFSDKWDKPLSFIRFNSGFQNFVSFAFINELSLSNKLLMANKKIETKYAQKHKSTIDGSHYYTIVHSSTNTLLNQYSNEFEYYMENQQNNNEGEDFIKKQVGVNFDSFKLYHLQYKSFHETGFDESQSIYLIINKLSQTSENIPATNENTVDQYNKRKYFKNSFEYLFISYQKSSFINNAFLFFVIPLTKKIFPNLYLFGEKLILFSIGKLINLFVCNFFICHEFNIISSKTKINISLCESVQHTRLFRGIINKSNICEHILQNTNNLYITIIQLNSKEVMSVQNAMFYMKPIETKKTSLLSFEFERPHNSYSFMQNVKSIEFGHNLSQFNRLFTSHDKMMQLAMSQSKSTDRRKYKFEFGEVSLAETLNYRTLKPVSGGLFCESLFGPIKDWHCQCGRLQFPRAPKTVKGELWCPNCFVQVTRSVVRRVRMAYIQLGAPVLHVWYKKKSNNPLLQIFSLNTKDLLSVLDARQLCVSSTDCVTCFTPFVSCFDFDIWKGEIFPFLQGQTNYLDFCAPWNTWEVRPSKFSYLQNTSSVGLSLLLQRSHQNEMFFYFQYRLALINTLGFSHTGLLQRQVFQVYKGFSSKNDELNLNKTNKNFSLRNLSLKQSKNHNFVQNQNLNVSPRKRKKSLLKSVSIFRKKKTILNSYFLFRKLTKLSQPSAKTEIDKLKGFNLTSKNQSTELNTLLHNNGYIKKDKFFQNFVENSTTSNVANQDSMNSLFLTALPVLPADLRPIVQVESGKFATSDINDLYRFVVFRNNRLKRFLQENVPDSIFYQEMRLVQHSVDALFDNEKLHQPMNRSSVYEQFEPLSSLSDRLMGKNGRFRLNLLGKRVDYSGRSVIVVGPKLRLFECGLPIKMAFELFFPFLIQKLLRKGLVKTTKGAKYYLKEKPKITKKLLQQITQSHPILLNRAPTLHRMGIQSFFPVLVEGKAIQLHPLICPSFNADFDGDQMAVHVPLRYESQIETRFLLLAPHNWISPADGDSIISMSQDMVLGFYYLTYIGGYNKKRQTNVCNLKTTNVSRLSAFFSPFQTKLHQMVWIDFNTFWLWCFSFFTQKTVENFYSLYYNTYSNNKGGYPLIIHEKDQNLLRVVISREGFDLSVSPSLVRFNDTYGEIRKMFILTTVGRLLFNKYFNSKICLGPHF